MSNSLEEDTSTTKAALEYDTSKVANDTWRGFRAHSDINPCLRILLTKPRLPRHLYTSFIHTKPTINTSPMTVPRLRRYLGLHKTKQLFPASGNPLPRAYREKVKTQGVPRCSPPTPRARSGRGNGTCCNLRSRPRGKAGSLKSLVSESPLTSHDDLTRGVAIQARLICLFGSCKPILNGTMIMKGYQV